jgi:hypothetical protein
MDIQHILANFLVGAACLYLARLSYTYFKNGTVASCGKCTGCSNNTPSAVRPAPQATPLITLAPRPARAPSANPRDHQDEIR